MKHEESVIVKNLPADVKYQVMEIKANQNGYKTTSINADGMIVKSETINVVFINSKGKVPSTGDSVNLQSLVVIIGCSSLLLYYVSRKKRLYNSL